MDASLPCFTLGEVCLQVLCVRGDVQPHQGMACRSVPRTCMVLAVRLVMFLGVVARHAQSGRAISWISCLPSASASGHTTQTSTPTRSLPAPREQFQPGALPHASRRNTNLTSTDCDVNLGTESECESCEASSENQVLCVAVITKAEGRRYSQMYRIP